MAASTDARRVDPGVHRLSNPTELLDHGCRKPNPVRGGNVASSGTGRVRQLTGLRVLGYVKGGRAIEADHLATRGEAVSDVFTMAFMLTGRLLAESLRVGADLEVADLRVVRIGRNDVSNSATPSDGSEAAGDSLRGAVAGQPPIWMFLDFRIGLARRPSHETDRFKGPVTRSWS